MTLNKIKNMTNKKRFFVALLCLLLFPMAGFALTFDPTAFEADSGITDDLYTAGEKVELLKPVYGDLIAAGGELEIGAPVSQDLALVGGSISVDAEVGDDARLAGGDVQVDSVIKGDLIVGGGNLVLGKDGFVGGDFVFGGGNVRLDGTVNGDVIGVTGELLINGTVMGNVRLLNVDSLRFGPKGQIKGNLTYRSPSKSPDITSETVTGSVTYSSTESPVEAKDLRAITLEIIAGFSIFGLLTLLFSGLFFLWGFRFLMTLATQTAWSKPLPSLGLGILFLFVTPILSLIFLVTGVGLPMGLIVFALWCILLYLGKLIGLLLIGSRIVRADSKSSTLRLYGAFALGALIYMALALVPLFGWLLRGLISLLGVGALSLTLSSHFHSAHKKKTI